MSSNSNDPISGVCSSREEVTVESYNSRIGAGEMLGALVVEDKAQTVGCVDIVSVVDVVNVSSANSEQVNSASCSLDSDSLGASVSEEPAQMSERTLIAERLSQLRDATMRAVKRRERLPQPLFWSLFHTEVSEIRKKRAAEQKARMAFLRGENPL